MAHGWPHCSELVSLLPSPSVWELWLPSVFAAKLTEMAASDCSF